MPPAWEERVIRALEGCRGARNLLVRCARIGGREYCIYKYKVAGWRAFQERPCLAWARGAVVIEGERLILPFTKFFNINETPWTAQESLPPAVAAYEKLDGTLVNAWLDPYTGDLRLSTRGLLWSMSDRGVDPGGRVVNPYARGLLRYAREHQLMGALEELAARGVAMFELVVPGEPASRAHTRREQARHAQLAMEKGLPYLLAARRRDGALERPEALEWPLRPRALEPGDALMLQAEASRLGGEGLVAWLARPPDYPEPLRGLDPLVKAKNQAYIIRVSGFGTRRGLISYALARGTDDLAGLASEGELACLEEARRLYMGLARLLQAMSGEERRRAAARLRGHARLAVEKPGDLLALVLRYGPRDPCKLPEWLRGLRRRIGRALGLEG